MMDCSQHFSMNDSDVNASIILERINREAVRSMVPLMVLIMVLMIVGLIGNISVCYYYGFRVARTPSSLFILVLSGFDLVMSVAGMPMEIIDLHGFYTFDSSIACKTLKFLDAFVAIGSLLTLLAIGFDRFRRICRPFEYQLGKKAVKFLCLLCAAISLMLAWPTFFLYCIVDVPIKTGEMEITGKDCTFTDDPNYNKHLLAMNVIYLSLFSIVVIILVVMYSMIVHAIFEQKKTRRKILLSTSLTSLGSKTAVHGNDVTNDRIRHSILTHSSLNLSQGKGSGLHTFIVDKKTVKFTILMFTITTVILLGFVPYLVLSFWRIMRKQHPSEVFSGGDLVAFQMGIRSVLLNAAINPLVYGFFYAKFRLFCYNAVCCCCRKQPTNDTYTSTQEQ